MLKISDFSRLTQVSVKALRYYDEIGLFKPSSVDSFTGYRYYAADQLPRLNRILAFKDLGLSLEQVAQPLVEDLPAAQLRGMLRLKRAEIQQEVEAQQERLKRVEARLTQIEKEGTMPQYDVVLKKVNPQLVAAVRDVIPAYNQVGRLYGEIFAFLGQNRVSPSGPPLAIYYDPEYKERDADVEAAVPISVQLPSGQRVKVRELPGAESMACVVHQGAYDSIGQAYSALMSWIEANGYRVAGPNREIFLRGAGPNADPNTYITEVQFPVEKA